MRLATWLHCAAFFVATVEAFTNSYLDSLKTAAPLDFDLSQAPDEHYAKDQPMAGWAGYKHERWGGYLDNLQQSPTFEEGKKSDYGHDVRWGAEVYLSSISSENDENH